MKKSFELSEQFKATSEQMYNAWLSSIEHTNMTGGEAICSNEINGVFSAWDGYISGKNVSLKECKEIVQEWRTKEFKTSDESSELILKFKNTKEGCLFTLTHRNIPEGNSDYEKGWVEHYFEPMKEYFERLS